MFDATDTVTVSRILLTECYKSSYAKQPSIYTATDDERGSAIKMPIIVPRDVIYNAWNPG